MIVSIVSLFQKSSIETKPENGESDKSATELEEGEVEPATHDESSSPVPDNFYDKKKSFFDTISCEGMLNFSIFLISKYDFSLWDITFCTTNFEAQSYPLNQIYKKAM